MHAVSFQKGCYIGQEIVERIRAQGRVNRELASLEIEGEAEIPPASKVIAGEKEAGEVTSAVYSPRARQVVAMAFLRAEYFEPGTALSVLGRTARHRSQFQHDRRSSGETGPRLSFFTLSMKIATRNAAVVVPTFNEAENVAKIVETIFRLYPEIHLLIVDDQSPDGTAGIVRGLNRAIPTWSCWRAAVRRASAAPIWTDSVCCWRKNGARPSLPWTRISRTIRR